MKVAELIVRNKETDGKMLPSVMLGGREWILMLSCMLCRCVCVLIVKREEGGNIGFVTQKLASFQSFHAKFDDEIDENVFHAE